MRRKVHSFAVLALGAIALVLPAGCQEFKTTSTVSADEAKNFKGGGPIPPQAQAEIAKRMQAMSAAHGPQGAPAPAPGAKPGP